MPDLMPEQCSEHLFMDAANVSSSTCQGVGSLELIDVPLPNCFVECAALFFALILEMHRNDRTLLQPRNVSGDGGRHARSHSGNQAEAHLGG